MLIAPWLPTYFQRTWFAHVSAPSALANCKPKYCRMFVAVPRIYNLIQITKIESLRQYNPCSSSERPPRGQLEVWFVLLSREGAQILQRVHVLRFGCFSKN